MMNEDMIVPADQLMQFIENVFTEVGLSEPEAKLCADVLIKADLWGIESHGIARLKMYFEQIRAGQVNPRSHYSIIKQSPTTALIDGNHAIGMITGYYAMELAIDKARLNGVGIIAVRNSAHYGAAGYYAMMAVENNMIGITMTNSQPEVAPTFGVMPLLGTNPIAFAAPTDESHPFLYDAATSICAQGKFETAVRKKIDVPLGRVIDNQGNFLTDAEKIVEKLDDKTAAILPIGGAGEVYAGHKGYGLGTIVEILCAALQGGNFLLGVRGIDDNGNLAPFCRGHLFVAINIENFISIDEFRATTGSILRQLRSSPKAPGEARIYTAGEKEFEHLKKNQAIGIKIDTKLKEELVYIEKELGLKKPTGNVFSTNNYLDS